MLGLIIEYRTVVTKLIDVAPEFVIDAIWIVEVSYLLNLFAQERFGSELSRG